MKQDVKEESGEKLFDHVVLTELTCDKCHTVDITEECFVNCIESSIEAFLYEYGEEKDQVGKGFWECDCGGTMFAKPYIEKK